jgi:hypothetical protein
MAQSAKSKIVAFAALLLSAIFAHAKAETALEVQSWCREIAYAKLSADHVLYTPTYDSGLCWGAFAATQAFSGFLEADGTPILRFCAPETSTRVQYIKVFEKFVESHPATAHLPFAGIATQALTEAFPCVRATPSR